MLKVKNNKKINMGKLLTWLLALMLILNCQSVWQNSNDKNYHIYELTLLLIILNAIFFVGHWGINVKSGKKFLVYCVIYYLILLLLCIFSVASTDMLRFWSRYISFPICVIIFLSKAPTEYKLRVFKYFFDIVSIIAFITFVMWTLSTLNIITPSGTINIKWGGNVLFNNYNYLYFSSPYQYIDWIGVGYRRNIGIFTEGPMFMLVLVLALLFYVLLKDYFEMQKGKVYVIVLALISTFSISGYLIALVLWGTYLANKYKHRRVPIICIMIFLIAGIFISYQFLMLKMDTASFFVRLDDIKAGITTWIQSPFVGNGYENQELLQSYMSAKRSFNIGLSNSLFSVMAYGGILFASIYIYPVYIAMKKAIKYKDFNLMQFGFTFFVLYLVVIFYTFYINFFVWAYMCVVYSNEMKIVKD